MGSPLTTPQGAEVRAVNSVSKAQWELGTMQMRPIREMITEGHSYHHRPYRKTGRRKTKYPNSLSFLLSDLCLFSG